MEVKAQEHLGETLMILSFHHGCLEVVVVVDEVLVDLEVVASYGWLLV